MDARRTSWVLGLCLLVATAAAQAADKYKPFVLAYKGTGEMTVAAETVGTKLAQAGFQVVGSYSPFPEATILAITNDELKQEAAKSEFGGYAAAQRVAITKVGEEVQVAYTNPTYMAHAYRLEGDLKTVSDKLAAVLGHEGEYGPEKAMSAKELRKYHYMFGMEYFDDPSLLAEHDSYEAAVQTVEAKLAEGVSGVSKIYRVDIPGKQETVFGVALRGGDKAKYQDDAYIMSEIDFKPVRSTAHLPYEMLVSGNKVYALYARFRIAINFPDLSMMGKNSFMNIMQSPAAIERALTLAAGGTPRQSWE
ncbi:MAG: hypothetical protein AB7U81_09770 [Thiohalomonadaceae bacterium]